MQTNVNENKFRVLAKLSTINWEIQHLKNYEDYKFSTTVACDSLGLYATNLLLPVFSGGESM